MKKSKNSISSWLKEYGDPEIESFIEKNLAITEKVRQAMDYKGWKSKDLAKAMDKTPSEVSKWLSGTHNLTLKSIIKMEIALGLELTHTVPVKEYEYIYFGAIQSKSELIDKANDYETTTEEHLFDIAM
jgi:transcriptional regulator with XRE-family HTH domain